MIERWHILTERQKQIALGLVLDQKKYTTLADEIHISRSRMTQVVFAVYALLGVRDQVELAFELGKHWKEISATVVKEVEKL